MTVLFLSAIVPLYGGDDDDDLNSAPKAKCEEVAPPAGGQKSALPKTFKEIQSGFKGNFVKEPVYARYVAREIEWHMWQHDGSKHIKQIFGKLNRGEKVTTEDVASLFPAGCDIESITLKSDNLPDLMKEEKTLSASGENSVPVKKHGCVLIRFCCRDIPFILCLKKSGIVVLYVECTTTAGHYYLTVNKKVPNENQLMEYAYEHYDVFAKHLYALLNKHISMKREADPFAIQMQNAFEQFGYAFNQTIEPVLCFVVNAENTYAFTQRWCRQQYGKGRTVPATAVDLQPVYKLLSDGSDVLCNRVGKFFQSTRIVIGKRNGKFYWKAQYHKPREGEKWRVTALFDRQRVSKYVFVIEVSYLCFDFSVEFERKCDLMQKMCYGYDKMVVKLKSHD